MTIRFVVKRTVPPPVPPPEPHEANFNFDPNIYIPPEGDNVDFIFTID